MVRERRREASVSDIAQEPRLRMAMVQLIGPDGVGEKSLKLLRMARRSLHRPQPLKWHQLQLAKSLASVVTATDGGGKQQLQQQKLPLH
jgi:hypothetical protein